MRQTGDEHWTRERDLDRRAAREPSSFKRRRPAPYRHLSNPRLADIAAGLHDGVELETAGVLQPPVKVPVVPPEPEWSPYRIGVAA